MKVEIYSLYWKNTIAFYQASKKVMDYFRIPVDYQCIDQKNHALWIDEMLSKTKADVVAFFDIDCVPTEAGSFQKCLQYIEKGGNMIGLGQSSNHINGGRNIFVAPSFCIIDMNFYKMIGKPSAKNDFRADVMESFSKTADDLGFRYRVLLPFQYEKEPKNQPWYLGNHGRFGIGCYYPAGFYNLYESRLEENLMLYQKRCQEIVEGSFDPTKFPYDCNVFFDWNGEKKYSKINFIQVYFNKNRIKSFIKQKIGISREKTPFLYRILKK